MDFLYTEINPSINSYMPEKDRSDRTIFDANVCTLSGFNFLK